MRKKKTKSEAPQEEFTPELPQNIIPVGERVFEDKNIYIHQNVYAKIHKFAANKTENEHGGILIGRVVNELGKENTIIEGFIEAKHTTATPTTLTFTHETWEYFHSEIDKKHKDKKIVGWIHTHPNFGIFLSENDRFIHQNFFTDSNQVAYVVDPIQNDEGFFFWIDGKLERCPGFYIFDKNGVKIKQNIWNTGDEDEADSDTEEAPKKKNGWLTPLLIILLIVSIFAAIFQTMRVHELEKQLREYDNYVFPFGSGPIFVHPGQHVPAQPHNERATKAPEPEEQPTEEPHSEAGGAPEAAASEAGEL